MNHRRLVLSGVLLIVLAAAVLSCGGNPAQPSPPLAPTTGWHDVTEVSQLVGTAWSGTTTFATGAGPEHTQTTLYFVWGGQCYDPPWCSWAEDARALGDTAGVRTVVTDEHFKLVQIGDAAILGSGHWDRIQSTTNRQQLTIASKDFSWGVRGPATWELTRVPWPSSMSCPLLINCADTTR